MLSSSVVFIVGLILPVYAQGGYVAFPETVSIPISNLASNTFILKAIAKQNGDIEKVAAFKLDPTNVVSVLEGGSISAKTTDPTMVFEQAKAKSSVGSLFQLQKITGQGQQPQQQPEPEQNYGFSIAGLTPGVYTLDIIAAKNNAKAAYEGIVVIGQNPENQEVKQVVEKEITNVDRGTTIVDIVPIFQAPPPAPAATPTPNPQLQQLQPQPLAPLQTASQPPGLVAQPQQQGRAGAGPQFNGSNIDQNGRPLQQGLQQGLAAIPLSGGGGGQAPANQIQPSLQTPPSQQVPQTLAGQQQQQQQQPQLSSSSNEQPANGNGPDPCLVDPNSPECKIVDVETPSGAVQSCPTGTQGLPPNCLPVKPESQPAAGLASTNTNDQLFGQGTAQTGGGVDGNDGQTAVDTAKEDSKSGSAKSNHNNDGGGGDSGGSNSNNEGDSKKDDDGGGKKKQND